MVQFIKSFHLYGFISPYKEPCEVCKVFIAISQTQKLMCMQSNHLNQAAFLSQGHPPTCLTARPVTRNAVSHGSLARKSPPPLSQKRRAGTGRKDSSKIKSLHDEVKVPRTLSSSKRRRKRWRRRREICLLSQGLRPLPSPRHPSSLPSVHMLRAEPSGLSVQRRRSNQAGLFQPRVPGARRLGMTSTKLRQAHTGTFSHQ